MKVIGIIPAKGHSERLPGKNRRMLGGRELYQWSVAYAQAEGIVPVVSTDDEEIAAWCEAQGVAFVREQVDDSDMRNCIDQVLAQFRCNYFALLQPSSPLRKPGLLRQMLDYRPTMSIYTAQKVKLIGHIGDKFQFATRDQDPSTRFLHQFDGNLLVVNAVWYGIVRRLFDDGSGFTVQQAPHCLQIDTPEDYAVFTLIWNFFND